MFKAACIQINSSNNMDDNINRSIELIKEAKNSGADFVFTPENTCFMSYDRKDFFNNIDEMEVHKAFVAYKQLAKELDIWLLIGSIAVVSPDEKGRAFNRSILFDNSGNVVSKYDKIHLFDVELPTGERFAESNNYCAGNESVIAGTPWGDLGMTICYDLRFPHLFRHIAKQGVKFISIPAAFVRYTGEAHWEVLLRARAIENGSYIFAPAQTGKHSDNRETFGHSMIIDPWGKILANAGSNEGFIIAEIDTSLVDETRDIIPSLKHDKDFKL